MTDSNNTENAFKCREDILQSANESVKPLESNSVKERKLRTRKLIDMGGLVIKAGLESFPSVMLYGSLLSLNLSLKGKTKDEVFEVFDYWTLLGKQGFAKDGKREKVALSFKELPPKETLDMLKKQGLSWNNLRKEWEGMPANLEDLKEQLYGREYDIKIL